MSARIVEVRNALGDRIRDWWTPTAPDEVLTPWDVDLDTAKLTGRKVLVMPSAYTGQPATRAEDTSDYTLVVLVAEKYPDAGRPLDLWIDERVAWCESLLNFVGNPRGARLLAADGTPGSGLWPQTAECTTVYDVEELAERKLFLSVLTFVFREIAEA